MPAQREAKADTLDGGMSPGGGMSQADLVSRHPVVLQDPVRHQVRYQTPLERRKHHMC